MLVKDSVIASKRPRLLVGSILLANFPDFDFLPGLLTGDPRLFHHQGMHSVTVAVLIGVLLAILVGRSKRERMIAAILGVGVYLSHILLDLLVDDPSPPLGAKVFWPFSEAYFIFPLTIFKRFDYYDPVVGILMPLFSVHNLWAISWEVTWLTPFAVLVWYFGKHHHKNNVQG